jgi:hypothetical protein
MTCSKCCTAPPPFFVSCAVVRVRVRWCVCVCVVDVELKTSWAWGEAATEFCWKCNLEWHPGITCDQAKVQAQKGKQKVTRQEKRVRLFSLSLSFWPCLDHPFM